MCVILHKYKGRTLWNWGCEIFQKGLIFFHSHLFAIFRNKNEDKTLQKFDEVLVVLNVKFYKALPKVG